MEGESLKFPLVVDGLIWAVRPILTLACLRQKPSAEQQDKISCDPADSPVSFLVSRFSPCSVKFSSSIYPTSLPTNTYPSDGCKYTEDFVRFSRCLTVLYCCRRQVKPVKKSPEITKEVPVAKTEHKDTKHGKKEVKGHKEEHQKKEEIHKK